MPNLAVTPVGDHKRADEVTAADWDGGVNPATKAPAIGFNAFSPNAGSGEPDSLLDVQTQSIGLAAEDLAEWPVTLNP